MISSDHPLSVSQLTRRIKDLLDTLLIDCFVEGEISNLRRPASGHLYFSLKDAESQIRCVFFRGTASKTKFQLKDGLKVICRGRVSVYERDGQYQLYVASAQPQGKGSLQLAFEQLKERLEKEGLFDVRHKKTLPYLPSPIGVVTSATGAVIRDILHVLDRRFPAAHVILSPVRVQGEEAKNEIAEAIALFNKLNNVEVIILARGGGSLEDLWAFNEEKVARAIFESKIPIISAIGHETDYTISDFVADIRVPTPSAAAEVVLPSKLELETRIENCRRHLFRFIDDLAPQYEQRLDTLRENLNWAQNQLIKNKQMQLEGLLQQIQALNPLAILQRGYSMTTRLQNNRVVYSSKKLKKKELVKTRLSQGSFTSEVVEIFDEN